MAFYHTELFLLTAVGNKNNSILDHYQRNTKLENLGMLIRNDHSRRSLR